MKEYGDGQLKPRAVNLDFGDGQRAAINEGVCCQSHKGHAHQTAVRVLRVRIAMIMALAIGKHRQREADRRNGQGAGARHVQAVGKKVDQDEAADAGKQEPVDGRNNGRTVAHEGEHKRAYEEGGYTENEKIHRR